jgi:hypothetical protein
MAAAVDLMAVSSPRSRLPAGSPAAKIVEHMTARSPSGTASNVVPSRFGRRDRVRRLRPGFAAAASMRDPDHSA